MMSMLLFEKKKKLKKIASFWTHLSNFCVKSFKFEYESLACSILQTFLIILCNLYQGTPAATETMSTEWTDEKHSMYLKSMEASFVNQLYNSMDTHGRHTLKGNLSHLKSSKKPQLNSRAASGQVWF